MKSLFHGYSYSSYLPGEFPLVIILNQFLIFIKVINVNSLISQRVLQDVQQKQQP